MGEDMAVVVVVATLQDLVATVAVGVGAKEVSRETMKIQYLLET